MENDELAHCVVCMKQMESGFLDDDGVCLDCEEAEFDGQPDEAQE